MTYEEWMQQVDRQIEARVGVDHRDLADWRWHDSWEDGYEPLEAVEEFFEDEGMTDFF